MSHDLMVRERNEVVITEQQVDLIRRTICAGATDQEMHLFFYDCTRRGTHPLDKLIHFTKRSNKYTPITSIDFMRQRAHGSGAYAGEEEACYGVDTNGYPEYCTYAVYRFVQGQLCKWTATARWKEYYPGDSLGFMWKKMPYLMLAKCAEALALRKAFPAELQGLYVKEEMDQAGPAHPPVMTTPEDPQPASAELTPLLPTGECPPAPSLEESYERDCAALANASSAKMIADIMNESMTRDYTMEQRKQITLAKDLAMKRLGKK